LTAVQKTAEMLTGYTVTVTDAKRH